jgi:hypothetical protein
LSQNSSIIEADFSSHEAKIDIKADMQRRLIVDDQERNLVTIDFIRVIHYQNLKILLQKRLRTVLYKSQISDAIEKVFLNVIHSVLLIQLSDQCLHERERVESIATKFCLDVVNISSLEKRIDDRRIFESIKIDARHRVRNAKT